MSSTSRCHASAPLALLPLALLALSPLAAGCAEGLLQDAASGAGATAAPDAGAGGGNGNGNGNGGGNGNGNGNGSGGGGGTTGDGGAPGSAYNIDLQQTSVSGFSAGGYFAVQFHVAFSSIMTGAAIFAGGPFDCARGSVSTALTGCMSVTTAPDITPLVAATKQMASSGLIDDPTHLAGQRVYLFGGGQDTTVNPVVMDSLNAYYATFLSASSIQYDSRHAGVTHTMPTVAYGTPCGISESPWVGNCSYDAAGKALAQIYGSLAPAASTPSGTFISLAQGDFISAPASHSLGDTAYAYVPSSCAAGARCRVHVTFHGCAQEAGSVSDAYYKHAGFNEWADTNHIIVLYPQTIASNVSPSNPNACWDWWGYSGADYASKTGAQMAMVRSMLGHLATGTGGPGGTIVDAGQD